MVRVAVRVDQRRDGQVRDPLTDQRQRRGGRFSRGQRVDDDPAAPPRMKVALAMSKPRTCQIRSATL
jgi:hypothetical protein